VVFRVIIMPGKCRFQDVWTKDERYREWVMRGNLNGTAKCRFCGEKAFDVSNMGEAALKSHMKGNGHQARAKKHEDDKKKNQTQISDFVKTTKSAADASKVTRAVEAKPTSSPSGSGTTVSQAVLDTFRFATTEDTLRSEILWTLKMVTSHFSFSSTKGMNELLHIHFSL
jgi:hypothetical protein